MFKRIDAISKMAIKTYSIHNVKQLIDLNGDSTNFDITFKVASKNGAPFDVLVVDQATLDTNPNLQYRRADKGIITGTISNNKNIYQNHFLVLKSDTPCECDVEIIKKELPVNIPQQPTTTVPTSLSKKRTDGFDWVKILLVLGAIAGIIVVLYWLPKKEPTKTEPKNTKFCFYTPSKSIESPCGVKCYNPIEPPENPLLTRLKSLNLS